jgi:hypothetical protein
MSNPGKKTIVSFVIMIWGMIFRIEREASTTDFFPGKMESEFYLFL